MGSFLLSGIRFSNLGFFVEAALEDAKALHEISLAAGLSLSQIMNSTLCNLLCMVRIIAMAV